LAIIALAVAGGLVFFLMRRNKHANIVQDHNAKPESPAKSPVKKDEYQGTTAHNSDIEVQKASDTKPAEMRAT
jgi:hypothetical protein